MKATSLRKILISVLCALTVFTGAAAYKGFSNVNEAKASTVAVSSDIQAVLDAMNSAFANRYATAEYVQNYSMANGGTASGIMLKIHVPTGAPQLTDEGLYDNGETMINLPVDITGMTGDSNPFAGVIFSPDKYPETVSNANRSLTNVHIGLHNVNSYEGFAYTFGDETDGGGNYLDKRSAPEASFNTRVFYANAKSSYVTAGSYWVDNANYNYNTRARAGGVSLNGYATTPFNMYYDYATNTGYKNVTASPNHASNKVRLVQMFNVDPTKRTSVNFDDKYCGQNVTLQNYAGSQPYQAFKGYENGKARLSIRYIVKENVPATMLFTSFMGLDLTDPQNVAPANTFVQVGKADEIYCGEQTSFPEASVNDYFGYAKVGDFTGTVNVYKGQRTFEGAYGSYGAPASAADDEGLTLVASTVAYSSGYTFTEEGFYTLEYVQGDKIAYKTVNVVYDPIATANKIGDVSVNDLIGNFKSNNSTLTLAQGSATTPGSNVTFSGLKMNVTKNTADETLPVVVNYDKPINLKGFSYANRKVNVPLIGLVPIPATAMVGTMPENNFDRDAAIAAGTLKLNNEFEQIKIVLTDVNDETNKLEIIIGSSNTKDGSADGPCTDGKTYYNSQFSVIGYKGTTKTNSTVYTKGHGVKYGAPRQFSYLGYQQEATNVIYDYEKNAVFTNVDGNKNSGISDSYLLKYLGVPAADYGSIADPDNGGYYKACDEAAHQGTWDGFSTGEVKLSLEMVLNPEFDSANLMITNLFGLDLTKGQTTVAVNDYSNYVDTEELSEYSPSGELTVPSVTLKNTMLANYVGDYEGKVAVKLNGDEIANVDAGSKVNLNKPGVYNFVYDLPGDRTYVLTTKVKTAINLVLNGVGKLSFNGQSIGNGDLIDVYESLSANVKISDDWYFESISFVDGDNANVTHNYDNLNLTADIENLPLNGTLTITVRQYYLLNYLVKGNNYESIKVKQGLTAELPSVNPSVTGYNFIGWLLNNEPFTNANLLELTDSYSAEPINLTANLNPIIYTANVKVDEAFTSIATVPSSTGYYTIDSDLGGLGIPTITNSEYEFAGWFVNGKLITKGSDLPCANGETVYACFTIKYYEVTYKNGLDVLSVQKVSLSEKLSAKEFAKEGYRLEGWYVDSNKTQKYEFGKTLTGNLTLYANFVKIESNAQEGSLGSLIDNQGNVVNNASVGAFHNANVGGIITFVLTVIAALGLVAMGVLIILKKTKKETTVNEENE